MSNLAPAPYLAADRGVITRKARLQSAMDGVWRSFREDTGAMPAASLRSLHHVLEALQTAIDTPDPSPADGDAAEQTPGS